jgi:hypothetical protein
MENRQRDRQAAPPLDHPVRSVLRRSVGALVAAIAELLRQQRSIAADIELVVAGLQSIERRGALISKRSPEMLPAGLEIVIAALVRRAQQPPP